MRKYFPGVTTRGINQCQYNYYQSYNLKCGFSSMTIGLLLNSQFDRKRCYLEINPNKCFMDNKCMEMIEFLLSRSTSFKIHSFDIAVDVPKPRSIFRLEKDRRRKITYQASSKNNTEYCGARKKPGHCKLYDKGLESKSDKLCTRIEITFGNPMSNDWAENIEKKLPQIKVKSGVSIDFSDERFSSTDEVLIASFQEILNETIKETIFKRLDRKKQAKLKPYVYVGEIDFSFNVECIKNVVVKFIDFIHPEYFVLTNDKFENIKQLQKENSNEN